MMQAVLSNADHPEYGVVTIPFPIPREQFDHCIELVEALEIGNASARDCHVDESQSAWPVLNRLEGMVVNLNELDYLAKRLDSFDVGEAAQFQAMTEKLDLTDMKDLINLTFCCQQTTVITDFSDLEAIGRDHYMNLHGGCASTQELEDLDGAETARLLIASGGGTVTPYGVVYDNGMKLEQHYDGKHFPAYLYEPCMLMVALTSRLEPESAAQIRHLAENLDQFEFAPGAHMPAEYGRFMIQESGHFEYDPNLDEFYDYERYGLQRMEQQSGMFTDRGYVSYHGTMSLEELMMEDPAESYRQEQGFQMGGMA